MFESIFILCSSSQGVEITAIEIDHNREVAFLPDSNQGSSTTGFSIRYQSLILHAHTASTSTSPSHLYCQVDDQRPQTNGTAANGNGMDEENAEDDEDEDEDVQVREVRIYLPEVKR